MPGPADSPPPPPAPAREIALAGPEDTVRLGRALAPLLRPGDLLALRGGLGMGKTTLARGLVQALDPSAREVASPTYTLVHPYEGPLCPVLHFDLYRLEAPDEVFELGWDELDEAIALVEWPERAGAHLSCERLEVALAPEGGGRVAALTAHGAGWRERLERLDA